MKVLFVIPTLANGGAERAMSNITTHMPCGVEADLLLNSISDQDYPTNANIISLGMKPVTDKGLLYQLIAAVKRTRKLRRLKREGNYSACISFMDSANICNILSGNKTCKVIVSVRRNLFKTNDLKYRCMVLPVVRLLYNRADKIVAVSKEIRDGLIKNMHIEKEKLAVISNGYDIDEIKKRSHENIDFEKYKGKYNYISTGRYCYEKGQWHLIRAFRRVVDEIGDRVHLIILGQGKLEQYLRSIIAANKLEENVTLMPYTDNTYAILSRCDVYVMTSLCEGYSNALCEAVICGLPCVASDFRTSAREILAPDTDYRFEQKEKIEKAKYGLLVPVCSGYRYHGTEPLEKAEEILAEAMINIRSMTKHMFFFEDRFDIKEKVGQYIELI